MVAKIKETVTIGVQVAHLVDLLYC